MKELISPREAAERIGVSVATVKTWIHRSESPLPAISVGSSGRFYKVVANQIDAWLEAEAARKNGSAK